MSAAKNSPCLRSVMETISTVMEKHSPYAHAFKQMRFVEQEENMQHEPRLLFKRGPDCRRYHEPSHKAVVFVGEDGAPRALWCTPGIGRQRGCPMSPVM